MQATIQDLWLQARLGHPGAIAHLMNRNLQIKGIRAQARRQGSCLQIMLESARSLPPDACLQYILRGLKRLDPDGIISIRVHGRLQGDDWPEWTKNLDLKSVLPQSMVDTTISTALATPQSALNPAKTLAAETVTPQLSPPAAIAPEITSGPATPADPALSSPSPNATRTTPQRSSTVALGLFAVASAGVLGWQWYAQNLLTEPVPALPSNQEQSSPDANPLSPVPESLPGLIDQNQAPAMRRIRIKSVGDMVPGTNFPNNRLPEDPHRLFEAIKPYLQGADILLGNYESTLTDHPHPFKDTSRGMTFAFRSPPSYAKLFREVGFNILNIANNHSYDFNEQGFQDTMRHIREAGMEVVGDENQIVYMEANGVKTAFIGFATYPGQNQVQDLKGGAALVQQAKKNADVVVVTFHAGAEGSDAIHTRNQTEYFYGENRGNIVQFSRVMIDHGADLVIGHGPHVPRALELYKGRLIAYSLGNFIGYKTLGTAGVLGKSLILDVELDGSGRFIDGKIIPVRLDNQGIPRLDNDFASVQLIRRLTATDFPATPLEIDRLGQIISSEEQQEEVRQSQ
ncbi:CapA family protein [Candidatus Synechococcus calcipolaris G9]|uniref:CapA family protein n=1 Tax=Candidatus Synechococcus calcipolaris G9 TaxID=1497997 RepID=A0ABT6EYY8_9SYNE|nr:CapA family protein [Candidatus Synechococcus calcipolaris]MDG2990320.1 CapA family protein [Candidatus Synechococcus calcipolaris G9]